MIPPEDGTDRFGLNLTLVLTAVTFKYVISSYLPKTTYLTLLDSYVIIGFTELFLLVVENFVAYRLPDHTNDLCDLVSLCLLVPTWLAINVLTVVGALSGMFYLSWNEVGKEPADWEGVEQCV
eukprot:TRINITY_DN18559_c0_g1_i1.p1 TRINITY_DN18559_c0_g1~~TRINITY_DN18559_c0_g1_i1.p1  ORF type:complete len:123 (-),score=9.10 TRINITY_DN18559_c0_g1_i1:34-402(-)